MARTDVPMEGASGGHPEPVTFEPAPAQDELLIQLLRGRGGQPTLVVLTDGREVAIFNIAWGYDAGDAFAHVTTNISPQVDEAGADSFSTSEVAKVVDPVDGTVLFTHP